MFAVVRFHHVMAGACQQIAQNLAIVFLVFHHKNAATLTPHVGVNCLDDHSFAWVSTLHGSVNENTEPLPSSDSTQSLPAVQLDDAPRNRKA